MKRIATALSYSLFAAVLIAAVPAEAQTKDADTIADNSALVVATERLDLNCTIDPPRR